MHSLLLQLVICNLCSSSVGAAAKLSPVTYHTDTVTAAVATRSLATNRSHIPRMSLTSSVEVAQKDIYTSRASIATNVCEK